MAEQVLSTAIKLAKFVIAWKEQRENAAADLKGLVISVGAVQQVLESFDISRGGHVLSALTALIDSLSEIKQILQGYESKINRVKAFFFPANVSERVKRVESDMLKFVQILSLGVSMSPARVEAPARQLTALDFIQSESTKAFWKKYFGDKDYTVKSDPFIKALKKEFPEETEYEEMLSDLLMRLDNFNTGVISVCRLAEFVEDLDLNKALNNYKFNWERNTSKSGDEMEIDLTDGRGVPVAPGRIHKAGEGAAILKLPALVWVDDKPNHKEIDYVRAKGITLVSLKSTAEAKEWIRESEELLDTADATQLRIITNNVRPSPDSGVDINAGEDIVRFVRGRRHHAPIMVFCGDLRYAQYVGKYSDAIAANTSKDFRAFVDALIVK